MEWVIEGVLARSSRPGYDDFFGMSDNVPKPYVDHWINEARRKNICSIICLLAEEHLRLYPDLPGGLIEHYKESGFAVKHIPVVDYLIPPLNDDEQQQVWEAHQNLPKPVLIHCSAGIDRTGAAVRYIQERVITKN